MHDVTPVPDTAGYFHAPVVIDGAPVDSTVDEIFGPVLTVHRVADDDAALALANSRSTGLAGYVFSSDIDEAMAIGARLECGEVKVNGTSVLDLVPESTQGFGAPAASAPTATPSCSGSFAAPASSASNDQDCRCERASATR